MFDQHKSAPAPDLDYHYVGRVEVGEISYLNGGSYTLTIKIWNEDLSQFTEIDVFGKEGLEVAITTPSMDIVYSANQKAVIDLSPKTETV